MLANTHEVHQALNGLLADSFALYLKTKNYHWHVSGPNFRQYHLLFDEQATQILATTDLIAERVRKTGGATLRSIGEVARLQKINDDEATDLSADTMLTTLRDDNRSLIDTIREMKEIAEKSRDNATSGLADDLTDGAEQRVWFLSESLARP